MGEFIRLIAELIQPLWPLRIVWEWEEGLYYVGGRYKGTVGPGLKFVVPYLCEVRRVPVVPEVYVTPLQTVTLRDNSALTYSASLTVIVRNAERAYNRLGHYQETVVEIAAAMLSEGMADAEPGRFDPARGKRDRLLEELREAVNKVIEEFGIELTALRLGTFARGVRTMRLLVDTAVLPSPRNV